MKILVILVALTLVIRANGQTNNDYRAINGKIYDVNKSPQWISLTIPSDSKVMIEMREYTHSVIPQEIVFEFPHGSNEVFINNFPFNGANFRSWQNILYTIRPLHLKVFPLSHAITNYDAFGHVTIIPARPRFDFGIPTNGPAN